MPRHNLLLASSTIGSIILNGPTKDSHIHLLCNSIKQMSKVGFQKAPIYCRNKSRKKIPSIINRRSYASRSEFHQKMSKMRNTKKQKKPRQKESVRCQLVQIFIMCADISKCVENGGIKSAKKKIKMRKKNVTSILTGVHIHHLQTTSETVA